MENLLTKLNYNTDPADSSTVLDVYVIKNADGSPRWLFPAHAKKPLFLKFYHVEGLRSRIYSLYCQE